MEAELKRRLGLVTGLVLGLAVFIPATEGRGGAAPPAQFKDKIVFTDAAKTPLEGVKVSKDSWLEVRYNTADSRDEKSFPAGVVHYVVYGDLPELEKAIKLCEEEKYDEGLEELKKLLANRAAAQPQIKQYVDYYYGYCLFRKASPDESSFRLAQSKMDELQLTANRNGRFFCDAQLALGALAAARGGGGGYNEAMRKYADVAQRFEKEAQKVLDKPEGKYLMDKVYWARYFKASTLVDVLRTEEGKKELEALQQEPGISDKLRKTIVARIDQIELDPIERGSAVVRELTQRISRAVNARRDEEAARHAIQLATFYFSQAKDYSQARWWYLEAAVRLSSEDNVRAAAYAKAGDCCLQLLAQDSEKKLSSKAIAYYRREAVRHYQTVLKEFPRSSAARDAQEGLNRLKG